jgi:hypothetical protein
MRRPPNKCSADSWVTFVDDGFDYRVSGHLAGMNNERGA